MADFQTAFQRTLRFEGLMLELVPGDSGGLTFCGIARNPQPGWPGWAIVDAYFKEFPGFKQVEQACLHDEDLMALMQQFYRVQEWDRHRLGDLVDQELANQVYDAEVNIGDVRAIRALQGCLAIKADGLVGPVTLAACNQPEPPMTTELLVQQYLHWRKNYYTSLVLEKPQLKKFLPDWLGRCVLSTEAPKAGLGIIRVRRALCLAS